MELRQMVRPPEEPLTLANTLRNVSEPALSSHPVHLANRMAGNPQAKVRGIRFALRSAEVIRGAVLQGGRTMQQRTDLRLHLSQVERTDSRAGANSRTRNAFPVC